MGCGPSVLLWAVHLFVEMHGLMLVYFRFLEY